MTALLMIEPIEDYRPPGALNVCEHVGCATGEEIPAAPGANGCPAGLEWCCGRCGC